MCFYVLFNLFFLRKSLQLNNDTVVIIRLTMVTFIENLGSVRQVFFTHDLILRLIGSRDYH